MFVCALITSRIPVMFYRNNRCGRRAEFTWGGSIIIPSHFPPIRGSKRRSRGREIFSKKYKTASHSPYNNDLANTL